MCDGFFFLVDSAGTGSSMVWVVILFYSVTECLFWDWYWHQLISLTTVSFWTMHGPRADCKRSDAMITIWIVASQHSRRLLGVCVKKAQRCFLSLVWLCLCVSLLSAHVSLLHIIHAFSPLLRNNTSRSIFPAKKASEAALLMSEEGQLEGNAWDNGLWFDQSWTKWADCGLISLGQSGSVDAWWCQAAWVVSCW